MRYLLEGSIRKAAHRVRVTGQLIDAATGAHLWADHFDGTFYDVLDIQDQLTASIVGAIAPKVEQAEIRHTKVKPTESLDAYDTFLRGMEKADQDTKETVNVTGRDAIERAAGDKYDRTSRCPYEIVTITIDDLDRIAR